MLSRIHSSDTFIATAHSFHKYLLDCSWWKITYSRQLTLLVICQGQNFLWKTYERDDVANICEGSIITKRKYRLSPIIISVTSQDTAIWPNYLHLQCTKIVNLLHFIFTWHKECQFAPFLFWKTNKEMFKPRLRLNILFFLNQIKKRFLKFECP